MLEVGGSAVVISR